MGTVKAGPEVDLGFAIKAHLDQRKMPWVEEVVFDDDGQHPKADLLYRWKKQGDCYGVIECKMGLNAQVIAQALRLRKFVSTAWVAVPLVKGLAGLRERALMIGLARQHDIGVMEWNRHTDAVTHNEANRPKRLYVPLDAAQAPALFETHRADLTPPAGTAAGQRYQASRDQYAAVRSLLEEYGTMNVKAIANWLSWTKKQRLEFSNRMAGAGVLGIKIEKRGGERWFSRG